MNEARHDPPPFQVCTWDGEVFRPIAEAWSIEQATELAQAADRPGIPARIESADGHIIELPR